MNKVKVFLGNLKTHWKTPAEGRHIPLKEMTAFAVGGVGNGFLINLMYMMVNATFIPYMYQIDVLHGTNILVLSTVLNLVIQPFFAKMFDKPRSDGRGKFKVYFTLLAPLFSIFMIFAGWTPQADSEMFRTVFAYVVCTPTLVLGNLWYFVFINFPNAMTTNSQERSDLYAPINLIWSFAPTVLNLAWGPLREFFIKRDQEYMAFRICSVLFAVLGLGLSILIIRYAKERTIVTKESKEEVPLLTGVKMVLKNRPYMVRQVANIFNVLRIFINGQFLFIAAFKYSMEYGEGLTIQSALSLITGFGATPAMLLVPLLTRKMSKRNIQIFGNLPIVIPLVCLMAAGGFGRMEIGSVVTIAIVTAIQFLLTFNSGLMLVVNPAMDGELFDYQQYISGYRLEGTMGLVGAWIAGLLGQLITYIPTFIQRSIGFQQGETRFQSNLAYLPENMAIIDRWFNAAAIITIVAGVLYMITYMFYNLDEKKHAQIIKELESRANEEAGESQGFDDQSAGYESENEDVLQDDEIRA